MRGKILLITILAAVNSFLVFFAIGFNSKHALVEDPSLPPVDMEQVRKSVEQREAKPPAKISKPEVTAEHANKVETKPKSGKKAKRVSKSKHR
jgi:hypothetical protein